MVNTSENPMSSWARYSSARQWVVDLPASVFYGRQLSALRGVRTQSKLVGRTPSSPERISRAPCRVCTETGPRMCEGC